MAGLVEAFCLNWTRLSVSFDATRLSVFFYTSSRSRAAKFGSSCGCRAASALETAQRDLALTSVEQGFVPRLRYVFNRVEYVDNDPELPVQR